MNGEEGCTCRVQSANMWQQCSLSAVQRKTFCAEQSWWPEFDMFGLMPWCSFPWQKLLPRLAQKKCCAVYRPNSIHKFTFFFRGRWFLQVCVALEAIVPMKEKWRRLSVQNSMLTCFNIEDWQLCRERQPLCNSHDGLNLTCLDQCHGVRSHGTSSTQGWHKRIVVQSTIQI